MLSPYNPENYFTKRSSFMHIPGNIDTDKPITLSDLVIDKTAESLGKGSYGEVRACTHRQHPDIKLAIKSMKKTLNLENSNKSDIERDVQLLLDHSHLCPYIVNCHGYLEGEDQVISMISTLSF